MSLMRLLAATRSIVNVKDRLSPYEMRPQNLLPKFGHSESYARTAAVLEDEAAERESGDAPETQEEPLHMKTLEGETQVATQAEPTPAPVVAQPPVRAAYPHGRWTFWKQAQPQAPLPSGSGAVQGELALDLVKVVRNDLNDADLEVVSKPKPPKPPADPAPSQQKPAGTGPLWGRLSSRWFGANGKGR